MEAALAISVLKPLLDPVVGWISQKMKLGFEAVAEEGLKQLHIYLNREYGGWKQIVKTAVEVGVEAALRALTAVKTEVVKVCCEDKELIKQLTKFAAKTTIREMIVKAGTKYAIKKIASAANPVGIVSDLAQAGLEFAGYKEKGKTVGKYGNIVSVAMTGGFIAGPPGVAVGALAGFAVWGVGEVVGGLVDRAFGK